MTRLFLAAPVFSDLEDLVPRTTAVLTWYFENRRRMKRRYGIQTSKIWTPGPGEVLHLSNGSQFKYGKRVPKGITIRMTLFAALEACDTHSGVSGRESAYFVQIDGSGAFEYDSIFNILERLEEGDSVVLGQRTGNWFMPHPERKIVELFENFLLRTWYTEKHGKDPGEWPDAQAGCWGMRLSELQYLALTAPDYELEFDLVASAVIACRPFVFTPPLVEGRRIGGSGMQTVSGDVNHAPAARKMHFIAAKLGFDG